MLGKPALQAAVITNAPPLPPRGKKIISYMNVGGSLRTAHRQIDRL